MRLNRGLNDLLATANHLDVLRALWRLPEGLERSGRDIARRAGVSQRTASRVLHDLAAHGAVTVRRVPPATYMSLNRDHALVRAIVDALIAEEHVGDQLLGFIRERLDAAGVIEVRLFGSGARGEMGANSDADIALIAPPGERAQLLETASELYDEVWRRFGVRPSFLVGESSIEEMVGQEKSSGGVWHRVKEEGVAVSA